MTTSAPARCKSTRQRISDDDRLFSRTSTPIPRGITAALSAGMTNIDIVSLATVVGGAGKATTTTKPATATSTAASAGQTALTLGGDALQGCLSAVQGQGSSTGGKTTKASTPNAQSLGLTCALGAGESLIKGLGGLFGGK
ncbi:MAG TPA: hypothetical protein VGG28_19855 [Kofleriaceae bacterium]